MINLKKVNTHKKDVRNLVVGSNSPKDFPKSPGTRKSQRSTSPTKANCITLATNLNGHSAIIPFASGFPIDLITISGFAEIGSAVGFGYSVSGIDISTGVINFDGTPLGQRSAVNFAFVVPKDGAINSLFVFFRVTDTLNLNEDTATIQAQLYEPDAPDSNTFIPLSGTLVTLTPTITGNSSLPASLSGSIETNIPVVAGDRLVLVLTIISQGLTISAAVIGTVSAGLLIS